jgi:hypothetical protein
MYEVLFVFYIVKKSSVVFVSVGGEESGLSYLFFYVDGISYF